MEHWSRAVPDDITATPRPAMRSCGIGVGLLDAAHRVIRLGARRPYTGRHLAAPVLRSDAARVRDVVELRLPRCQSAHARRPSRSVAEGSCCVVAGRRDFMLAGKQVGVKCQSAPLVSG